MKDRFPSFPSPPPSSRSAQARYWNCEKSIGSCYHAASLSVSLSVCHLIGLWNEKCNIVRNINVQRRAGLRLRIRSTDRDGLSILISSIAVASVSGCPTLECPVVAFPTVMHTPIIAVDYPRNLIDFSSQCFTPSKISWKFVRNFLSNFAGKRASHKH